MLFISHSSSDAAAAAEICNLLEQNRMDCFIAPRDIRSGKEYAEEIVNGIERSTAMVLLLSKAANSSPHVLREVERAVSKRIPILVYKLEDVDLSKSLEYFLMTHQWINEECKGDYSKILSAAKRLEAGEDAAVASETAAGSPGAAEPADKGRSALKKRRKFRWFLAAGAILSAAVICLVWKASGGFRSGQRASAAENRNVQVGDTLTFGSYNNGPIQWRVLRLEEKDGEQTAVLVSRYILTMKAFDAAESGKYNYDETKDYIGIESEADTDLKLQAYVRGNSDWQTSNIRTWLNAETEIVDYAGQAPLASAMSERQNGYQNEPGFLYNFTEDEIGMLEESVCHTPGNALVEGDVVTCDRVFLLSVEELAWFDEAGISKLTQPTAAAIEQDTSQWYEVSVSECGLKEYCWWLRTPVEGYSSKAYLVENGYGIENDEISNNLKKANVGLEGFGIRPAVTINLEEYFKYSEQQGDDDGSD